MSLARSYALTVLVAVNFGACQAGRLLLGLLTEPVKRDLLLSDAQLGVLAGVSLGLAYLVFSLPVAWMADRYNRRLCLGLFGLLYLGGTLWSAAAPSFAALFGARTLVAVSEAGLMTLSASLIADFLPVTRRPMGYAVFTAGVLAMISLNFVVAGWLEGVAGWRGVFAYFAGAYALILAGAVWLIKDPRRHLDSQTTPLGTVIMTLLRKPTFLMLIGVMCLYACAYTAVLTWAPAFLIRTRDFSQAGAANFMGLSTGVLAIVCITAIGQLFARARQRSIAAPLLVAMWLAVTMGTLYLTGLYFHGALALACLAVALAASPVVNSVIMSSVQEVAQPAYRATAMALLLIPDAIMGGGAGGYVTGVLSDLGRDRFGHEAIQYALVCVVGLSWALAALLYWRSCKSIERDAVYASSAGSGTSNIQDTLSQYETR